MECYVCQTNRTLLCTSCCLHTCCKTCAKDIQPECHCYSSPNMFIICNKNPNTRFLNKD